MKIDFKYYSVRFLAVIGLISIISMISGSIFALSWLNGGFEEEPEEPKSMILSLDFTNPISEKRNDFNFSIPNLLKDTHNVNLLYITRAIKYAKDDPKVKGIIAKFDMTKPSLVHVSEITKMLNEFRKTGKFTYAFATSYGSFTQSGNTYLLASYFNKRWLQPIGSIGLSFSNIDAPFGRTALSKIGVESNFMRRAEYKGAMENISRDSFSPTVKNNLKNLMNNINKQKIALLANGLKISPNEAKEIIQKGPFTSNEALKYKLITKLGYEDEMKDKVKKLAGKEAKIISPANYLYFHSRDLEEDDIKGQIAIIYAKGVISDTPSTDPFRFGKDGVINTKKIVKAFKTAAKDKNVKAILFRINSPGGSPVASETIRHAMIKAKKSKKPIFVSMGKVAASGGYWIAMEGDKIIADKSTITGSIGVVAGKFVFGKLLDRLGIKWDKVNLSGSKDNMWSLRKKFDAHGKERMNAMLDETYNMFTTNVAKARNIDLKKIDTIAKGRVFTGEQAVKNGLVDQIGTLNDAIALLKKEIKLKDEDVVILRQIPEPETPETLIYKMIDNIFYNGAMISEFLGQWQKIMTSIAPFIGNIRYNGEAKTALPASFNIVD